MLGGGAKYQSISDAAGPTLFDDAAQDGASVHPGSNVSRDNSNNARQLSRNMLPNRAANPVSRWVTSGFTSLWATYVVLVLVVGVLFVATLKFTWELQGQVTVLRGTVQSLEADLAGLRLSLHGSFDTVSDDITRIETNYTTKFDKFDCRLEEHDAKLDAVVKTLNRLTNRTSNAEVLDSLHQTKHQLETELFATKTEVSAQLLQQTYNVTTKMRENQQRLQQTEDEIHQVVRKASAEIHSIQANVTDQLGLMKRNLETTASELNDAVDGAQATIHSEVKLVQDNIEQYVAITNSHFAAEDDFVKYQLAGTFTLLGCLMSGYHLTGHLRHYNKPEVQRRIMAVLWMVPIYGITSWFSLVMQKFEAIFSALRDCYEAYAVYTFIALLIAIMEDGQGLPFLLQKLTLHVIQERKAVEDAASSRTRRPAEHLRPPFPCCYEWHKPSQVAKAWLYQCRLMALQFVVSKPFFSLVPFIFWMIGYNYDAQPPVVRQEINWASPKLYITFFSNVSVAVAFYGLLSFYHGTEKDLAWCDPWPKFLCIKGVVFMTFWQGLVLQFMASAGFVLDRQATQLQNLLICIEMLLASIAHFYVFPYYEWEDGYKREKEKSVLIRDTLALRDFVTDMKMMVSRVEWEYGKEDEESASGMGEGDAPTKSGELKSGSEEVKVGNSPHTRPQESPLFSPDAAAWNDTSTLVDRHTLIGLSASTRTAMRDGSIGNNSADEVLARFGKAVSQLSDTVEQEELQLSSRNGANAAGGASLKKKRGKGRPSTSTSIPSRPLLPHLTEDFFGADLLLTMDRRSPARSCGEEEESIFGTHDERALFRDIDGGIDLQELQLNSHISSDPITQQTRIYEGGGRLYFADV